MTDETPSGAYDPDERSVLVDDAEDPDVQDEDENDEGGEG